MSSDSVFQPADMISLGTYTLPPIYTTTADTVSGNYATKAYVDNQLNLKKADNMNPYEGLTVKGSNPSGGTFLPHHPEDAKLTTVKLTKDNVVGVAKRLLGGTPVSKDDESITYGDTTFKLGDWIVQEYDYEKNEDVFRVATLDERKTYQLK